MKTACLALVVLLFSIVAAPLGYAEDADSKKQPQTERPRMEVCFVLDTTGSMGGLIQGAKDKIWSIANEMMDANPAPDIRFALIGYRDRNDAYVTQRFDLTSDIDDIHTKLMAFQATGGGDQPESVNQALLESVEKIDWSDDPKVLKLIFLVGDAPPHMDYDETQYPEICALALKKDLIINTIQCGSIPTTKKFWTEIAYASEGQYVAILQSGGTVAVHTPFDKEIAELNGMLNDTICAYGDRRVQEMAMSKLRSQSAAKAESVADRADYLSKGRAGGSMGFGGNTVIIGTDDLVEMLMDESVTFENIDDKKLPDGLKKLQPSERRAELERRIAARKKFQAQMEDLVSKRADYIKTEREKNAGAAPMDAFDEQVKEIIHDQAAELGIEFSE